MTDSSTLQSTMMLKSLRDRNWKGITHRINNGADPNMQIGDGEILFAAIAKAIYEDNITAKHRRNEQTALLLTCLEKGGDVNMLEHKGRELMMVAAAHDSLELVTQLHARGVDLDQSFYAPGNTPLHLAKSTAMIYALLDAGASIYAVNADNDKPMKSWSPGLHLHLLVANRQAQRRPFLRDIYDHHLTTLNVDQQAIWRTHFDPTPEHRANVKLPEHSSVARYLHTLHNVSGRGAA